MRKTAILLTGSAGFIGSNLARYFLNKRKIVLGIDNLQLGSIKNIKDLLNNKNFSFIKFDISNFNKLDKYIKKISKSITLKLFGI